MKYFNKEDIEYKDYKDIESREFGKDSTFIVWRNELSVPFLIIDENLETLNPNNTSLFDALSENYVAYSYPEGSPSTAQLETNVEMNDLYMIIKEPQTGEPLFQMSYGTSPNSVWLTGSTVTDSDQPRLYWETNDPAHSNFFVECFGGDHHYACVSDSRFSNLLKAKTSEVYKIYAKLLMGDKDAIIKIKNKNGLDEEIFDDALFIHFNKNYNFDDIELLFTSMMEMSEYYMYDQFDISETYLNVKLKNKSNNLVQTEELTSLPSNENSVFVDIKWFGEYIENYYNYYKYNKSYCQNLFRTQNDYFKTSRKLWNECRYAPFKIKEIKYGKIIPEHNLIILRPATNIYNNMILDGGTSGILSRMYHLILSNITSLIPSTTFVNGLMLPNGFDPAAPDTEVIGSQHYDGKAFVDIVTTDSEDSYFELLMGFKSRLEYIKLTQHKKETIAEYSCIAEQNEFNYSNNQSFLDENRNIRNVVPADEDSEDGDVTTSAHTYITRVGLYNDQNQLLAVGNFSQPIKKDFNTKRFFKVKVKN